jgi:Protein of unknown function (DUF1275)
MTTDRALPAILLALTVVTGVVDAASYLGLGHTLTANMTGNGVHRLRGRGGAGLVGRSIRRRAPGAFLPNTNATRHGLPLGPRRAPFARDAGS